MELLGYDTVSTILTIAILLLGLIAAIYVLTATLVRTREARLATAAIESAADKHAFARQFEAISLRIETSPLLQGQWASFKATLFFSHNTDGDGSQVQSTANVHELFSAERVAQGRRDERLLPSLFLTLAMLLAVVGAAASMSTALNALSPSVADLETVGGSPQSASKKEASEPPLESRPAKEAAYQANAQQMALRQFLSFGKSSLILAIAGLLISLFLTLVQRFCRSQLRRSLLSFSHALQRRIVNISFETAILSKLSNISAATSGMDPAVNSALAKVVRNTIEQSSTTQVELLAEHFQSTIDQHATLSLEACQTAADQLRHQIGELISEQITEPLRSTGEQFQEQCFGLRENLFSLSNLIANHRNLASSPDQNGFERDPTSNFERDLAPFVEAAERVQNELASSNHSAIQDISQNLNSKLDNDVVDPLREISTSIAHLNDNLDAIQSSIATAWPEDLSGEGSIHDLIANVRNLQGSLELERIASNEQLLSDFRDQLADCITQPVNDIASTLECFRAEFQAIEESALKVNNMGGGSESVWHEAAERIEARLENLDAALSAVKSHAASVSMYISHDDGNDKIREQKQATIDDITHNLESGVVSPLEELITSTERLRQALSEDDFQIVDSIVSSGNEMLETTKLTATELLDEIRALAAHRDMTAAYPATFTEQLLRYCEDLGRTSEALLRHSSAIESQLSQLVLAHSSGSSEEDRAETDTDPSETSGHSTAELTDALPTDQHPHLSDTQQKALEVLNSISTDGKSERRSDDISDDDIDNALHGLTRQARQDWEIARRDLIERIDRDKGVLDGFARQWDASPSTLTNDFRQLIDAAPSAWSHNAYEVASAIERIVHLTLGETHQLFEQPTSGRPSRPYISELQQTADALHRISDHLTRQTAKSRDVLDAQITNASAIIERSSASVFATTSRLGDQLSSGARTVAEDILETLIKTSADLDSITRSANETALPALASLLYDANHAREMIRTEVLDRSNQSGETDTDEICVLHETIFEMANTIAGLSRNLTTTTDRLVQSLHALSNDIRIREGQFAMETPGLLEADTAPFTTAPNASLS